MELASEDLLRLNVLVANARAIRFDDHRLIVYGKGPDREYEVRLSTTGNSEACAKKVREFLSTASFGAPRRYPKYIHRWASMGQINNVPVDKLLMLGEPDAVMAIAHARELTPEQAALAWWAWPAAELARVLLSHPHIVAAPLAAELATWLLEFLPFETESVAILHSTTLLLQSGILSAKQRQGLWNKGQRKKAFRIAFLLATPLELPQVAPAHPAWERGRQQLAASDAESLLLRVISPEGQAFIQVAAECLGKCADQEEMNALLRALAAFFTLSAADSADSRGEPEHISDRAQALLQGDDNPLPGALLSTLGLSAAFAEALLCLCRVDEGITTRIFSSSDAVGTVMRKQLTPIITFINDKLRCLCQS